MAAPQRKPEGNERTAVSGRVSDAVIGERSQRGVRAGASGSGACGGTGRPGGKGGAEKGGEWGRAGPVSS
ncbi:hypothetical protein GCM10010305_35250 [Streptomyces termitum]|uniref:Uncharacterized protein n=1 Tax=Streptomyces termitum TaxID=67368 RepID=A0A918T2Y9_9ACTN|nr:hypothetical protein GCM10010305_35250 [Streptomyces termitum]